MIYLVVILCLFLSFFLTPFVKKLAFRIGATDKPDNRKVHKKVMPRLGGLAIYVSFISGVLLLGIQNEYTLPIIIGSTLLFVVGVLDDIYTLSAKWKLIGQLVASLVIIYYGNLLVTFIHLPFGPIFELGLFSLPLTLFWIVGITNAVNLIDGLDGLAAGVSCIALITMSFMASLMGNDIVQSFALLLVSSVVGFLFYNFHPAKIFMGDSGSLYLGFMIAVLSLLGFKNITFFSLIIPILILGVPISDTFFAIVRRLIQRKPLSAPDKSHLHHCLLRVGFSHRQVVLIIYAIAAAFSVTAIIFSQATLWGGLLLIGLLILCIELLVESVGLVSKTYRPLLNMFKFKKQ
jgi:UDP-GlcNAc:undecaprenyl-phosphate/decaprenyl-phosphate GlcNAc-1-phosphate transferase